MRFSRQFCENLGGAGNFPLPVKDHNGEHLYSAAHGCFLKETVAFGEPTPEQFYLEGTLPYRMDPMLKQRKSVRRKKQGRETGMD